MNKGSPILPGTLDMLILKALTSGPRHGYAIMRRIREASGGELALEEGSLYPALHRLVRRKLLTAEWGTSENNRKARFYRITAAGRRRLGEEVADWRRMARAIGGILGGGAARA